VESVHEVRDLFRAQKAWEIVGNGIVVLNSFVSCMEMGFKSNFTAPVFLQHYQVNLLYEYEVVNLILKQLRFSR